MKRVLFTAALAITCFAMSGNAQAEGFFGLFKKKGVPSCPPHHLAPPVICVEKEPKPPKIVKTHTVELSRKGFTKWEEHCCGIKMKGNYMKVTYETFYSDGSSVVWDREYRS